MSYTHDADLRALIVTDRPLDALPAAAALSDAGYSVECVLPESLASFVQSRYVDRFSLLVISVGGPQAAGLAIVSLGGLSCIHVLALAGSDPGASLLLAQAGILVVNSENHLADVAKALDASLMLRREPLILSDAWLG
jgi:hypothetical protein